MTSKREQLKSEIRRRKIVEYRKLGWTISTIATAVNCSIKHVQNILKQEKDDER